MEYYLSDENLKYDKFFHEKITADKDGWLDPSELNHLGVNGYKKSWSFGGLKRNFNLLEKSNSLWTFDGTFG